MCELFAYIYTPSSAAPTISLLSWPPQSLPFLLQMEDDDQKELQLLPAPHSAASSSNMPSTPSGSSSRRRPATAPDPYELAPSLDLQLSISLRPIRPPPNGAVLGGSARGYGDAKLETSNVKALKWEAAEQIRLAAMEKAYAERVRELTRREMELAQSEFARARHMWERAREEVDRAERMKERATRQIDSTCMEITCQSCRQRFRPAWWRSGRALPGNGNDIIHAGDEWWPWWF